MNDNPQSCQDKITYTSPDEARAANAANSYFHKKPNLSVYRCQKCQLFHLTNRSDDD